jgi:hypothetical protein
VLLACQGQPRLAPSGHVIGIDMDAALKLGAARGHDIAVLSELLPAAEAGVLEALWDTGWTCFSVEDLGRKKHGSMERSLK